MEMEMEIVKLKLKIEIETVLTEIADFGAAQPASVKTQLIVDVVAILTLHLLKNVLKQLLRDVVVVVELFVVEDRGHGGHFHHSNCCCGC